MVALATMAEATTRLRVGTFVLNNDFRHPALLAREAATIDLLTDGRLELGLGAGHAAPEYAEIGLPFDPAGGARRAARGVGVPSEASFDGDEVTFEGAHYRVTAHRLSPLRRPTLLIGGNGDRVLRLAAEVADIVGFTGLGATQPDGQRHATEWEPDQIDAKVALVRSAAGDRLDQLELNALVQYVEITNDRGASAEAVATRLDVDPDVLLGAPYMLIGTVAEIVEQLHRAGNAGVSRISSPATPSPDRPDHRRARWNWLSRRRSAVPEDEVGCLVGCSWDRAVQVASSWALDSVFTGDVIALTRARPARAARAKKSS